MPCSAVRTAVDLEPGPYQTRSARPGLCGRTMSSVPGGAIGKPPSGATATGSPARAARSRAIRCWDSSSNDRSLAP